MSGGRMDGVRELKARLSIVEVVRRYVNLRNAAGGRWVAPCPFHQETKPSFSVNEEEGFYYCFGCQAHGDVIDFYCKINGLDFREGIEQLAAEAGITLQKAPLSGPQAQRARQEKDFRRLCMDMYARAQKHYRDNLNSPQGKSCRDYLQNRGMDSELARSFGLGYSQPGWDGLLRYLQQSGVSQEQALQAGLLSRNDRGNIYDRFRGRLMFPIHNLSGQVIAFGGRVITSDQEPKYINSSDTPLYKKGEHLYGLYQARREITHSRYALLTEGYIDVLTLHKFGYTNACGVLGTALTKEQIKRLSGFCSRVDLLFDGDRAGRKAALRSAQMLMTRGLSCRVALMPEGEDVDSLLQQSGKGAFDALMEQAPEGLEYCMRTVRDTLSPKEILEWARTFTAELDDPALLSFYLPKLAGGLGLAESEMRESLAPKLAPRPEGRYPGRRSERRKVQPGGGSGVRDKHERQILSFAVRCPQHFEQLDMAGAARLLVSNWAKSLWEAMRQAKGGDVLPLLEDDAKRFFIQQRMECVTDDADTQAELEEICSFLGLEQMREKQAVIRRSLPDAGGDDLELLRALQETLGRKNG